MCMQIISFSSEEYSPTNGRGIRTIVTVVHWAKCLKANPALKMSFSEHETVVIDIFVLDISDSMAAF